MGEVDLTADTDSDDDRELRSALAASLLTAPAEEDAAQQAARRLEVMRAALDDSDNEDLPLGCLVDQANAAVSHGAAGPSTSNARSALAASQHCLGQHSSGANPAAAASAAAAAGPRGSSCRSSDVYYSQEEAALDAYLAAAGVTQPQQAQTHAHSHPSLPCSPTKGGHKENVQPWCPSSPDAALPSIEMLPMKRRARRVGVRRRSGQQDAVAAGQGSPLQQQWQPPQQVPAQQQIPAQQQQQAYGDAADWMDADFCGAVPLRAPQQHAGPSKQAGACGAVAGDFGMLDSDDEENDVDLADQQAAAPQQPAAKRRRTAPAAQRAPSNSISAEGAAAAAAAAAATAAVDAAPVKLTAAERKEQGIAEKAAKAAARKAETARKKAEKAANKAANEVDKLNEQCAKGKYYEREMVLLVDRATQQRPVCQTAIEELMKSKGMAYSVQDLPLGRAVPGAVAFAFKRRRLTVMQANTAAEEDAGCVDTFDEAAPVPFVLLVFDEPKLFMEQLQKDRLAGVMVAAKQLHADCSLGVVVAGLQTYVKNLGRSQHRQGMMQTCMSKQQMEDAMLQLQLSCPALQLRQVSDIKAAGEHVFQLARQLGKQPYKDLSKVDADEKKNDSASFKKAKTGVEERGRATDQFAKTLGRMSGMAGAAVTIASQFASFGMLISSYQAAQRQGRDPTLLTANLTASNRRVGPVKSRRLFLLTTSEDPDLVIQGEDGDD